MSLPAIWPYALAATLLLAVVILGLLALLLKRSAKASQFVDAEEPEEEEAAPSPAQEQLVADIPSAFRRAAKYIDRAADGDRKNVPLFLMVGDQGSRDSDMLANAGLELTWGAPEDAGTSLAEGRGFWVFDRGVVLDVAGDDTGWDDVITQLQRLRPKRPVDGVIVTLSCAELLEAAGSELKRTDLAARAAKTYRKLWDAQQRLGFRLPTYVLVTGCEKLTGFHALTGSLHQQSRRQIVGWSNPNGVEAVYRADWVDEAFEAMSRRLEDVVMEVFAEGTLEGDQLVRLTPSAASLAAGLRPTLDNLFKASAYHGSLIFRGLYFCGRESASILEDAPPAGPVAFLAEVLDRKVFIEHRLASPTARTVMARNRTVSIMKTAAAAVFLFAIASLAWAAYSFSAKNEVLLPVLTAAETAMAADSDNPVEMRKNAIMLLNGLAAIEFKHYESYVVPAGWFASFHGKLEHAFSDAFHDIVLRALRETLEAKMTKLAAIEEGRVLPQPSPAVQPSATSPAAMNFDFVPAGLSTGPIVSSATVGVVAVPMAGVDGTALGAEAAPPWSDAQVGSIASSREFLAMRDYAKKLEELDEHIRAFNRLRETNDLHQVGKLVKYAFDLELPDTFYKKADLYKKAMADATGYRPIDVDAAFREGTARKLNRLANEFHDAVFRRNAFEARLQRLSSTIQNVTYQPPSAGDTTPLQSIYDQLKRVESDLSGPELEWAFAREFDFGADYNRMLDDISGTSYLGAPVAAQVRDATAARWKRFQQGLTWASSPLTKTILAVHADHPEMHLSKESLLLQSALHTFLDQSFVVARRTPGSIKTDLAPHHRLKWDPAALGQAVNVVQAYDRFRGSTLTLFPHDVRGSIDRVARERALGDMLEAIRVARQEEEVSYEIDPEEQLRADVASFSAMVPSLETVLEASSRLSPEVGRQVAASMSAEAYRILRNVNSLLERENAYRTVDDLGQWDGKKAPTPRYWAKADDAEVASWLDATRARIAYLAMNYAKPQLTWLAKSRTPEPAYMRGLVAGWQAIIDDLRDHESKKPGNPIAVLEEYIGVRMAKVTAADCSSAGLPSGFRGGERSFFARTAQDLSRRVRTRCNDLAGLDATERYAKVADYFNQRLARRYPFADDLSRGEAVPADLRTFFKIFDEHKAVLTASASKGGLGEDLKEQRTFIEDMAKVRALFPASFDAPKADIAPSLDVEATFRVLKPREIDNAGQQIIDWGAKVGSQQATNRDPIKKMRWTVKQEVHISLRWADDGLRVPVIGSQQPEAQMETDRKVVWKYENTWSLFSALAAHPTRLEQLPEYDDVLPVTMTFDFSTKPANGPASDTRPARVFIRLALLAPGTNQPVELPHFPDYARPIPVVTKEAAR